MTAPKGLELPPPKVAFDMQNERQTREAIQREVNRCQKKDEELNPRRLVMTDTVTGTRYLVTVASGAWTLTAL